MNAKQAKQIIVRNSSGAPYLQGYDWKARKAIWTNVSDRARVFSANPESTLNVVRKSEPKAHTAPVVWTKQRGYVVAVTRRAA